MNIWIVVPAFNAEKMIGGVVRSLKAKYQNIVVVDDGSVDQTFEEAKNNGAIVLRHILNRGQGASLQTGNDFAYAQGADVIIHFDGDGQHQVSDIVNVIQPIINNKADIVLGSRYLQPTKLPWIKKWLIHKPALTLQNLLTGLKLTDVHNGFRALNRLAMEKIKIRQDRMAHASEIIDEIARNKLRYVEVPVNVIYYEFGQGFGGGVRIFWDLLVRKILG